MKLKKSTLFYYSLAEMPINIALFPILVFIPKFYTGEMGVPLALAANIILAVRIFDVFTDPVVGYINDRTNTCLLYTSPSPRDPKTSRMPSSA